MIIEINNLLKPKKQYPYTTCKEIIRDLKIRLISLEFQKEKEIFHNDTFDIDPMADIDLLLCDKKINN